MVYGEHGEHTVVVQRHAVVVPKNVSVHAILLHHNLVERNAQEKANPSKSAIPNVAQVNRWILYTGMVQCQY